MADHVITISNTLNVWGNSPTNTWGVMEWGTDIWAFDGKEVPKAVGKLISESVMITDSVSAIAMILKAVSDTVGVSGRLSRLVLSDGTYDYVFSGGTDAEDRTNASYSEITAPNDIYAEFNTSSVNWVEQ